MRVPNFQDDGTITEKQIFNPRPQLKDRCSYNSSKSWHWRFTHQDPGAMEEFSLSALHALITENFEVYVQWLWFLGRKFSQVTSLPHHPTPIIIVMQ